ncbi:MAG: DUF2207 domain-containing protein [Tissierellia bacterium]|nr:DUF2207 domain-containing protein [Tissierellia bacterium]
MENFNSHNFNRWRSFYLSGKKVYTRRQNFIFLCPIWAYLLIKGLWVSFSKEGFQHDMRNETIKIRVLRAQFGKWAPLVSFGGYILLILAVILAIFLPSLQFLSLALYFGGLIFMIIMGLYVRKHVKEEKKKFF